MYVYVYVCMYVHLYVHVPVLVVAAEDKRRIIEEMMKIKMRMLVMGREQPRVFPS